MESHNENLVFAKSESWRMFDQISPRYDLLNHLLSFGLHIHWRNTLTKLLPNREGMKVLDLATGTADVLLTFFKKRKDLEEGVGLDMAEKMLEVGREKIAQQNLVSKIRLQHGDANNVPFGEKLFDVTSISFGIRNVEDPSKVLGEMFRILKNGGQAMVLEFSLPKNTVMRKLHLFYLRHVVPFIGWVFSGQYRAYRYLNQTIEKFPYGETFADLMRAQGFKNVQIHPLLFGVASIYVGSKSS